MLDRLDDALEPLARALSGKSQWDEMKENALRATESLHGRRKARPQASGQAGRRRARARDPRRRPQRRRGVPRAAGRAAHGVRTGRARAEGGLVHALGARVHRRPSSSSTTCRPFRGRRSTARRSSSLSDQAERDDHCANIYHKSLLYLVSHAFEATPRIPLVRDGVPIVGMEKHARTEFGSLVRSGADRPRADPEQQPGRRRQRLPRQRRTAASTTTRRR